MSISSASNKTSTQLGHYQYYNQLLDSFLLWWSNFWIVFLLWYNLFHFSFCHRDLFKSIVIFDVDRTWCLLWSEYFDCTTLPIYHLYHSLYPVQKVLQYPNNDPFPLLHSSLPLLCLFPVTDIASSLYRSRHKNATGTFPLRTSAHWSIYLNNVYIEWFGL